MTGALEGRTRGGRLTAFLLAAATAALVTTLVVPPASAARDEYEVKAAFLLNFARLVEWPSRVTPKGADPIVVSVIGSEQVERSIAAGVGENSVDEHRVVVRTIESADDLPGTHILFVSREEPEDLDVILAAARSQAALAVGETPGFANRGGVINFFTSEKKLRFEINPDAARDAGLKVSSRLLRLAVVVQDR